MTLVELAIHTNESINIIVLNVEGRLIALYDGKESIPEQFMDREVTQIVKVTFNTIWVEVK